MTLHHSSFVRWPEHLREWDSPLPVIAVTRVPGVLILWPADSGDVARELERVRAELAEKQGDVLIALAGPADDPLRDRLDEVRTLARAGTRGSGVVRLEDLPFEMLIHSAQGRVAGMIHKLVEPILQYDREHHTNLVDTLRAYIQSNLSLRATARALVTHRNTVAYRLERIRHLTGLNPRVIPDLLMLYVGLELKGHDHLSDRPG